MPRAIAAHAAGPQRYNLVPDAIGDHAGMDDSDADAAAILAVLRAETDAWLHRDFPAMAQHWVHSPKTRRMTALASLGTHVDEGWDAIASRMKLSMERFSTPVTRLPSAFTGRGPMSTSSGTWPGSATIRSGPIPAMTSKCRA